MSTDPLHYFRIEAAELVASLEAGLVSYEAHPESLPELFRLAHTLKGSARVVRQGAIGDLAHATEDVLAHHREAGTALSKQEITELLQVVDGIRAELATLTAPSPAPRAETAAETRAEGPELDSVRVPLPEMDQLAAGILEAQALAESLREQVAALGELGRTLRTGERAGDFTAALAERQQRLTSTADRIDLELRRLSQQTSVLRLLRASAAFPELERAARDAGAITGKEVTFSARGGNVKIDGHILSPLRAALLHLVRNAVAHGIEDGAERNASGKDAVGRVEVSVERRGARIAFTVRDDGGGIDGDAVRRVAAELGIEAQAERADELIFRPGVSTARQVNDLAGRGVGLDAVRATVRKLKGQLVVSSQPGQGACFEIVVPVSLSQIRALVIGVGKRRLLVPLDAIVATTRLAQASLAVAGEGRALVHEGEALPFRDLRRSFEHGADSTDARIAVVLRTSRGEVAIAADALYGTRDVTVRPLPRAASSSSLIAGVAFNSQGDPELVLDPEALLGLSAEVAGRDEASRKADRPILVIDDSLTTRMLEQSILEAAGYRVDVASCAEEGLEKALRGDYGLIVCDVEMPGMNGYEFTKETRSKPELQAIPVIMVTSLASEESRRRGKEAGVSAYIVKGEFDQGGFLRTVGELLS